MSYYINNKQSFLDQFAKAQDQLTQQVKGKNNSTNRRIEELECECAKAKREADEQCEAKIRKKEADMLTSIRDFNAKASSSIIDMQPYLLSSSNKWEAPVLSKTPTLEQINNQAKQRTYLPQVLVGYQKYKYGNRYCILPTYVDWQSRDPQLSANVGNLILTYSSQNSIRALTVVDSMVTRMLMALPVGKLRLSIIDPTSKGDENFSKWMEGCPELYSKKVYKNHQDITQHLDTLNDRVSEIRQSYPSRSVNSLVLHNKEEIKHEYELVILYDPFNERPYYAAALKNLMANGIKAGMYILIVQSDNLNPDVLKEFEFNSFTTAMEAKEGCLEIHKSNIQWNGCSFKGDDFEKCEYLPSINPQTELIDLIDPDDSKGLAQQFYRELNDGWKKANNSLTTKYFKDWTETYDDADLQCWTEGIEVPIGYNVDSQEELYFRINNERPHSFVQGVTGGGKSKFLCGVISSVTMKYSPDAVQLYLLDFKNGLAFVCYKGVPHVRWLFTVPADKVMLSEVLRDLEKEKNKRAKLFKSTSNSNDIGSYNKKILDQGERNKCIPRILLVVDECQLIYDGENSVEKRFISNKFEEIATQYRAYGIHLLLASQRIPSDMAQWISQVTNNFILKVGGASFSKLLSQDDLSRCDTISTRVDNIGSGAYSTQDKAYISMYGYDHFEEAGTHIRERAENLLDSRINSYETNIWDGELDQSYFKTRVSPSVSIEFGSNMILSSSVGVELKKDECNNVLLYGGALGEDKAKEVAMRTVISTLRATFAKRKMSEDSPTIYVVNAWTGLIGANTILRNLAEHKYIELVDPEKLGELLIRLKRQIENKESKSVLLYMIGTNRMDVLETDVIQPNTIATNAESIPDEYSQGASFGTGSVRASADSQRTGWKILDLILDKGPYLGIHTILQINDKDDMVMKNRKDVKIRSDRFKYMLFQKSRSFLTWPGDNKLDVSASIAGLSVEKDSARTIFSNSFDPDVEQRVIPFMIDELVEVANNDQSVGEYMLRNVVIE